MLGDAHPSYNTSLGAESGGGSLESYQVTEPIVHIRNRSRVSKISKNQTESLESRKGTTMKTENSPVFSKGSLDSSQGAAQFNSKNSKVLKSKNVYYGDTTAQSS
jgi:hypothetical protein